MKDSHPVINDVADTAFWVATYRAEETQKSNALFRDPLAAKLAGTRGQNIAKKMFGTEWTRWTVTIRTVVIDRLLSDLIARGVDTVVNLGTGLDTRPYRMNLPKNLKWIEVDFEKTILLKDKVLADEKPQCDLSRISMDLSKREDRQKLFSTINSASKSVLILTEGVIPYLSEDSVSELSEDLQAQPNFNYWITEYLSPHVYHYFKSKRRQRAMRNAPFLFLPKDWLGFFTSRGWAIEKNVFMAEVGEELKRPPPFPWWAIFFTVFMSPAKKMQFKQMSGYLLLKKS
jgi:methyltransferase (TIGR00027 family)